MIPVIRYPKRNTKALIIGLEGVTMYYSYEELIAISGYCGNKYMQVMQSAFFSRTTSRHVREWDLHSFEKVSDSAFKAIATEMVEDALKRSMAYQVEQRMDKRV